LIGDGRSAALVSRDGSIDWLCWPRFDSPSIFGKILDPGAGGSWLIGPGEPRNIERRYLDRTNVLRTQFHTPTGIVAQTDFMPVTSEAEKRRRLWPEHELIRLVECEEGDVEVEVRFDPRPDYGRAQFAVRDRGPLGYRIELGSTLLTLRGDIPLAPDPVGGLTGRATLRAGQKAAFSLTFAADGPAVLAPLGGLLAEKLDLTIRWWREWAARCRYEGPYQDHVQRSALVLKLLSYAPSGAVIAAPTTSLPERIGGDKNWDYRFCWLRDAAFTARALFGLGYQAEAEAFVSWLLHTTRLTLPRLRVLYDVFGEAPVPETTLTHLLGHRGSRPVRIGNAAVEQFQLDVYGEVIEAVSHFVRTGGELDRETRTMLERIGRYVCRNWHRPDSGIWEPRGDPQHFTHSRLLCWVALDRLIAMREQGRLRGVPVADFAAQRDLIRRDIEGRGWSPAIGSYTQTLGGDRLDATALLIAFHGFEPASSQRMRETYRQLTDRLGAGPGLLFRYEQQPDDREGAFAMCSFWLADFMARGGGTRDEAHAAFGETLAYANDLGLFGEEIDPTTGEALGNFPQAFTHVGLINAALSLAEREGPERSTNDSPEAAPVAEARA
jgi:GH15 family glucan-1,4-alpha-glucosidase